MILRLVLAAALLTNSSSALKTDAVAFCSEKVGSKYWYAQILLEEVCLTVEPEADAKTYFIHLSFASQGNGMALQSQGF